MGIKEGKPFLSPYKGGWGVGIEGTFIVTHWCINQTVNPRFSVLPRFPQLQIKRAAKEQPNPIQLASGNHSLKIGGPAMT